MKKGFLLLVLGAALATTSCNFFWNKMSETIEKSGEQQGRAADSLRAVIISQKEFYAGDAGFAAKMDTVYASGFRLADLSDSLKRNAGDERYQTEYNQELKFFRNYVNRHFDYDDAINGGLSVIGMGSQFHEAQKKGGNMPFNMQGLMTTMVKPQIMHIIISCRKQYNQPNSVLVSTAF